MCKTIKQKVKFKAPPTAVYDLLTDDLPKKIGAKFSDGHCSGIIVDLAAGKRVVQAWRSKRFPVGIFSMATIDLKPTQSGGCELTLTHRGVPKELIPSIEKDWRELYWEKMKAYFQNQG